MEGKLPVRYLIAKRKMSDGFLNFRSRIISELSQGRGTSDAFEREFDLGERNHSEESGTL